MGLHAVSCEGGDGLEHEFAGQRAADDEPAAGGVALRPRASGAILLAHYSR